MVKKIFYTIAASSLALSNAVAAQDAAPGAAPGAARAAPAQEEVNNGTDPTKLTPIAETYYTYTDLRGGFKQDLVTFGLTVPVGESKHTSLRVRVPLNGVNAAGNDHLGFGDIKVKMVHIAHLEPTYGIAFTNEFTLDTASRTELGQGKWSTTPGIVYATFHEFGILAPSLIHTQSFAGDKDRDTVSLTTFDFYIVPKLQSRQLFMTLDPSLNYDWKNDHFFPALAVTTGTLLGKAFGGDSKFYIKPSVAVGGDRPFNWGIEAGFNLLNF